MSERSFSERATRSAVKNPLLSTAVTGLSLEDLTHNAVLLPVRSQDLGASQDSIKSGPQATPLRHTPSTDPNLQSNITSSVITDPLNINANHITQTVHHHGPNPDQVPPGTQSKPSLKTDDDFDVNEYFARLHGTRYVSAPINSPLKEDQNANLEGAEENLEEVNLNDTLVSEDTHQSITADIAQNFSQLPQVLPHVASAVFSSFSNYLSSKSREPTPDFIPKASDSSGHQEGFEIKKPDSSAYRDVHFQKPESEGLSDEPPSATRKLSDAKPIGVPPCFPPPSGSASNTFRITTKRKTYAQIPGLSTGHKVLEENTQHSIQPSSQSNIPPYFLPTDTQNISSQPPPAINPHASKSDAFDNKQDARFEIPSSKSNNTTNVNVPFVNLDNAKECSVPLQYSSVYIDKTLVDKIDIFQPRTDVVSQSNIPVFDNSNYETTKIHQCPTSNVEQPTVPPPPIYPVPPPRANSQSSVVNKSVLPPSIARRIGSTQPVLKTYNVAPVMDTNFFIPKPLSEASSDHTKSVENIQKAFKENAFTNFGNSSQINDESIPKLLNPTTLPSQENILLHENVPAYTSQPSILMNPNQNISMPGSVEGLNPGTLSEGNSSEAVNVAVHALPTANDDKDAATPAPPIFFNPTVLSPKENTFQQENLPVPLDTCQSNLNAISTVTQTQEGKPTTLSEPPKLPMGRQNFRMTKKRPQYYAGPIENFSYINNKTTPILPTTQTTEFQGAVFTPEIKPQSREIQNSQQIESLQSFNLESPTVPLTNFIDTSINRHELKDNPFNTAKPLLQESTPSVFQKCDYSTAFDLSRPTTERFEPPKQESKGFGIIGSLKSKLSAIDINKIQDSVTTFFDPRYNETRKEIPNTYDAFNAYSQQELTHDQNFDIFVPYNDQTQDQFQQGAYQSFPNVNTHNQDQHRSHTQKFSMFDPNFVSQQTLYDNQDVSSPLYYQQGYKETSNEYNIHTSGNYNHRSHANSLSAVSHNNNNLMASHAPKQDANINDHTERATEATGYYNESVKPENVTNALEIESKLYQNSQFYGDYEIGQNWSYPVHSTNTECSHREQTNLSFFSVDKNESTTESDTISNFGNTHIDRNNLAHKSMERKSSMEEKKGTDVFQKIPSISSSKNLCDDKTQTLNVSAPTNSTFFAKDYVQDLSSYDMRLELLTPTNDIPAHVFSSGALAGANIATDTSSNSISEMESKDTERSKKTSDSQCAADITEHSHAVAEIAHSAISTPNKENNISRKASVSDLNICETCREVNVQSEEKEAEDLTTQLIENIIAPIQLLNPVEVPLTETAPSTDRGFLDDDQCAEISQITEKIIETLQIQSATEFFDREDIEDFENISNVSHQATEGSFHNYGWRSDFDEPDDQNSTLVKQSYTFGMESNSDNFYGGNSLFFDNGNTFTNASDEIKAVLINAQEDDSSIFFSTQDIIPTAPPAEDLEDNKSDVADGIDVHSIEQDANRDYSNFDSYVIEPSGTDDDKIESRERKKPTDGLSLHVDSFTDRVERYKQFEESTDLHSKADENIQVIENVSTVCSPPVTFASYFDTGNYAADTHYKNSLIPSPSSSTFSVTNVPISSISNTHACCSIDTDEFKATNNEMCHLPSVHNIPESLPANEHSRIESVEKQEMSSELSEITAFSQIDTTETAEVLELNVSTENVYSGLTVTDDYSTPVTVEEVLTESLLSKNTEKPSEIIVNAPKKKSQPNDKESPVSLEHSEAIQPATFTNLFTPILTSSVEVEFSFAGDNSNLMSDLKSDTEALKKKGMSSSLETIPTSQIVSSHSVPATFMSESIGGSSLHTEKPLDFIKNTLEKSIGVQEQITSSQAGVVVTSESSNFSSIIPKTKEFSKNEKYANSTDDILVVAGSSSTTFSMKPEEKNVSSLPVAKEIETEWNNQQVDILTERTASQITTSSEIFKPIAVSSQIKSHTPEDEEKNVNNEKNKVPFGTVTSAYSTSEAGNSASAVLPDPITFFDVNASEQQETAIDREDAFNRLASYFPPPPKTEQSKSFFELSQSQNHFKQTANVNNNIPRDDARGAIENFNRTSSFLEFNQNGNHFRQPEDVNENTPRNKTSDIMENSNSTRSFFGFSQNQNHFRQIANMNENMPRNETSRTIEDPNSSRPYFDLDQSQNHFKQTANLNKNMSRDDARGAIDNFNYTSSFFESNQTRNHFRQTADVNENTPRNETSDTTENSNNARPFFEFSQSQNHFRHTANINENMPRNEASMAIMDPNNTSPFFELSQNQNHYMDHGLTHDRYLANIELMRDLTSTNNLDRNLNMDSVVRTLNYFTVHYDDVLLNNFDMKHKIKKLDEELKKFKNNGKSESAVETVNVVDLMQTSLKTKVDILNSINNFDTCEINSAKKRNGCNNSFNGCNTFTQNDTIHNFQTTNNHITLNNNDSKEYEIDAVLSTVTDCIHCYNEVFHTKSLGIDNFCVIDDSEYSAREAMNSYTKKSNMKDVENQLGPKETNGRKNTNVSFGGAHTDEDDEAVSLTNDNRPNAEYSPLIHHWYYKIDAEGKSIWKSFSATDSRALEVAFNSPDLDGNTLVPTDGGRFDVNVMGRTRKAVYWDEKPNEVMRCSWFYKGTTDAKYVPYTEAIAEKLEMEYRHGVTTGEWHRRMSLPDNEAVVMHGPGVIVHFLQSSTGDAWSATAPATVRPRVVRRGHSKSDIEAGEPGQIDHLILMCHGVGSTCDIRFRPIVDVVDDFRSTSLQLVQSHYRNSYESGSVGRVEVLPISWHNTLHSGEAGVDRRLAEITLESIPRLRSFTNDTVLDVLFYTSPVYSQIIIDTVCSELNRIYALFKQRNPNFKGTVSLSGHSLGSVILYDLLCHQYPESDERAFDRESNQPPAVAMKRYLGFAGAGQSTLKYPTLNFRPDALYALGSPIAIFECIRGVESLGENFHLPTCEKFFNIFHPYDPIAYRIEPLINPRYKDVPPYLIPHHKGRKRMHLELKETMARVGADLRQRVVDSIRTTWTHLWKSQSPERELEKVVNEEMEKEGLTSIKDAQRTTANPDPASPVEPVGRLNAGRRVDRVLQEAPLEMINEYLFAMGSHVGYWESEDTMLLILREVYDALGVSPDGQVPPPTLTVQRERQVLADEELRYLTQDERPSTSAGTL